METYKIVRYYHPSLDKPNEDVDGMDGLSLEEAQEYCRDENTQVAGEYFDGYVKE